MTVTEALQMTGPLGSHAGDTRCSKGRWQSSTVQGPQVAQGVGPFPFPCALRLPTASTGHGVPLGGQITHLCCRREVKAAASVSC